MDLPQPISAALDVRDERLRGVAARALAAVDRVHLASGLPRIRLDLHRGDPVLVWQLDAERDAADPIWDFSQLGDDEFQPVETVIDGLFRGKGWLR